MDTIPTQSNLASLAFGLSSPKMETYHFPLFLLVIASAFATFCLLGFLAYHGIYKKRTNIMFTEAWYALSFFLFLAIGGTAIRVGIATHNRNAARIKDAEGIIAVITNSKAEIGEVWKKDGTLTASIVLPEKLEKFQTSILGKTVTGTNITKGTCIFISQEQLQILSNPKYGIKLASAALENSFKSAQK